MWQKRHQSEKFALCLCGRRQISECGGLQAFCRTAGRFKDSKADLLKNYANITRVALDKDRLELKEFFVEKQVY